VEADAGTSGGRRANLRAIEVFRLVLPIIRHHHEKFNG